MNDVTLVAAFLSWGLLPGWALLRAMRLNWTAVEQVAAAPGLSLAVVAASAYLAASLGWSVTPIPVMFLVGTLVAGVAVMVRRVPSTGPASDGPDAGPPVAGWLVLALPFVVAGLLEPVSTVPLLPPSLHDGLDHANWFRLIYDLGTVNPWVVLAPPLAPDGGPTLYPWGLHAWLALVARSVTTDPVAVLMHGLVVVSAVMPLSVYGFASFVIGRGWPAVGAAAFSVFFWWLPFQAWGWGGYPLLAGAVAAPVVARVAVAAIESRRSPNVVAVAFLAVGLATIHPSQAFVALIVAGVVAVMLVPVGAISRRTAVVLAALVVGGCLALMAAATLWATAADFLSRAESVGTVLAGDPRYRWPMGMYVDADMGFPFGRQVVLGVVVAAGAVTSFFTVRGRAVLALHVVWALLIVLAPSGTALTSLWYHAPERIWYAHYLVYPLLAALGVSGVVRSLTWAVRRWIDLKPWHKFLWPIVGGAICWGIWGTWSSWTASRLFLYAQRNENLTITDRRVLDDFRWVRANVPAGAGIFNAPADWGLLLPFTGHRTVFWSGGVASRLSIDWGAILQSLAAGGPAAAAAASDLRLLGLDYVYAAALDPALERGGRVSLARAPLDGVPGLEPVYGSPTARIFRVSGDGTVSLGLADSERVRFARFHPIEEGEGSRWRWTDGDSRLYVQQPPAGCHVRIFGPTPDAIEVRVDGREVPLTVRGYALPPAPNGEVEVAVVSPSVVPAAAGTGNDTRRLGVRVRDVGLRCDELRDPGGGPS